MRKKVILITLGLIVVVLLMMYVLNPFGTASTDPRARIVGYQPYRIPSLAMAPTLIPGEFIVVNTHAYMKADPQINDVIVFKYPRDRSTEYVKRVAARGGETVSITDGSLLVNNEKVEQGYLDERNVTRDYSLQMEERRVPEDHLFVLGDNRDNSNDGRFWGYVPVEDVAGKVSFIWYSTDGDRIGKPVE